MVSHWIVIGLLVTSCCLALVASFDPVKSVIPLVEEGALSRRGRDLLLSDEDDDYDFFQQKQPSSPELKMDSYKTLLDASRLRNFEASESIRVKALLTKLQMRSIQFLKVARETAHSAVSLVAAFTRLVENCDDNFVIVAQ